MKYIKKFNALEEQTAYLAEAGIDTYLGYVSENETVYYDDALPDFSKEYLTIKSLEDNNTIYLKASNSTAAKTISASTDNGETWVEYTSSLEDNGTALATLNTGDKLLVKGVNTVYGSSTKWNQFKSTGQFKVYGNIMSLISGDSFENADTLTGTYPLCRLFFGCTGLTSAKNLVLPATRLARGCYQFMFYDCTSLTSAPVLPATTLAESCYYGMFYNCTSLTTAPELPATTLANYCYQSMFNGCTSLNSVTCLATDISASSCTSSWLNGVGSTGTFVKDAAMTGWTTGVDGIPSGWTVQNA